MLERQRIYDLDNKTPEVRSDMITTHEFLHKVDIYAENLPHRTADDCPETRVRNQFVKQLERSNNVSRIPRSEVKGYVNFFTVPEYSKQRFRPIRETIDVNNAFPKETLMQLKFPTKQQICELSLHGTHFAAFDAAAWYDQFQYENGIADYLCFRKGRKFYRTNRLCMGQRHGCQIAQTTTLFLIDFPTRRCATAYAYIDNVIFVGSQEDVLHDSREFVARCNRAGVTLNDADKIASDIESCVVQRGEWCGVQLDFVDKTASLINKTLVKVKLSWDNRLNWTNRQFYAHLGLLFWSWNIIDVPVYRFYSMLKFVSSLSRILQADESLWDEKCTVFDSAWPALTTWTDLCLANTPRKIKPSSKPAWFLCTDASAWGWGYRAFNYATGEIRSHGQKWQQWQLDRIFDGNAADKMRHSVYAEPLAIYCSLCHLLKSGDSSTITFAKASDDATCANSAVRMKIGVATDNSSAQHTMNRGFASRSHDINVSIARLREAFPESEFDIDISFVPGHLNPADAPSRGLRDATCFSAPSALPFAPAASSPSSFLPFLSSASSQQQQVPAINNNNFYYNNNNYNNMMNNNNNKFNKYVNNMNAKPGHDSQRDLDYLRRLAENFNQTS